MLNVIFILLYMNINWFKYKYYLYDNNWKKWKYYYLVEHKNSKLFTDMGDIDKFLGMAKIQIRN